MVPFPIFCIIWNSFLSLFLRYRAEVLKIIPYEKDVQAELYYVDYGDTDTVPIAKVYELRTDFLRLHFQAIECYLAKIGKITQHFLL